ncbi:hypothetical protein AZH43_02490 [Acinetobacter pragensis]|uniref:Uncharacterized protein n=1 Tax=Acinetobacter pragensis TaxID=1806892 RepID=A0A151Y121_9GAMM|nr:hypothetical protein AZH43_02490 [Acinetobacter pragensis]
MAKNIIGSSVFQKFQPHFCDRFILAAPYAQMIEIVLNKYFARLGLAGNPLMIQDCTVVDHRALFKKRLSIFAIRLFFP